MIGRVFKAIGNAISSVYRFVWGKVLGRVEPFTWQFRRQKEIWGAGWWWLAVGVISAGLAYLTWYVSTKNKTWNNWWWLAVGAGAALWIWLILHILGYC